MNARKKLRDQLEFMADKFRADCPFAATVLRCLSGAMELDIDRHLADVNLDWMVRECRLMKDEVDEAARQAVAAARDRRRRSIVALMDANADVPINPRHN